MNFFSVLRLSMNYHIFFLSIGVFLMDRPIESPRVEVPDEVIEENRGEINSYSSIAPSKQCNVFEIPITSQLSHKSNFDSANDSSKEAIRSELPISSESSNFAIDSSKQASRSNLPISSDSEHSIDHTLMEDVAGNSLRLRCWAKLEP
ncbi:hypothetical protein L6452_35830 [Arctium lappa]|uniref:Uncharacterized protein n=1 Tax=Arctium lappa TaxID=4217 RepID=A0ACB8Y7J9_ARCLA|nr:hypothetical protein L6452_35830 [Arctium lappa]